MGVIDELKSKGYKVETREDIKKKGPFTRYVEGAVDSAVKIGTIAVGSLAALAKFRNRTKTRKMRTRIKELESVVEKLNKGEKPGETGTNGGGY
jgi:hypothetical protein